MAIELAPLPYSLDALAPHISERTMNFHYSRHHAGYVANLNRMIAGTAHEDSTLEDIVAAAEVPSALFNNAAQAWNHAFYWNSMAPGGAEAPSGELLAAIERDFGSLDNFNSELAASAVGNFASGPGRHTAALEPCWTAPSGPSQRPRRLRGRLRGAPRQLGVRLRQFRPARLARSPTAAASPPRRPQFAFG